ncbi:MAG: putative O-glycosylation ligase, exosortase A system-associated [Pseudomonadales bacterium]|nr:putative O-glycosylation ligase, exosortase A system-associated [Pseudomonadales bacterium]
MRDIALTVIVMGLLPYILMRPQVGIYTWSWLSYMNPHKLTWGFAYNFPFAQIVAIFTLLSILFSKEKKTIQMTGLLGLILFFIVWICVTTAFAISIDNSFEQLVKVLKIQLITLLTILVIKSKKDIDVLLWIIVLSIGFYGVKGGLFTIKTLGASRVWGPPGGFIQENNSLAVALLMVLPLMYYLRQQVNTKWIQAGVVFAMALIVVAGFGSQSRGAFIAIGATAFYLWLKLPNKAVWALLFFVLAIGMLSFMPDSWHSRMDTISNYQADDSAMGRINAWKMAINLANHRVFGGGFNIWTAQVYQIYGETWDKPRAAHSIYFNVLGEHGWIGLILFFSIFLGTWQTCKKLIKQTKNINELAWLSGLCRMIQVSLIAYATGGAFLSLSYFDLPWHLVSIVIICRHIVDNQFKQSIIS